MLVFNGKEKLIELAKKAGYSTKARLVASHTLFAHPETVKVTKNRNLFRIIRNFPRRGQKIDHVDQKKVICCDNTGPQHALEWSIGGMKKTDVQINHIYSDPTNVETYTALPNLCATPTFLAKLTDTDSEIKELLKYRSFQLYGFSPEGVPSKPIGYDELTWMEMIAPLENLEAFLRGRLISSPKSRTAISAREIGWFFSDFEPDGKLNKHK